MKPIRFDVDIISARQEGRQLAQELGFSLAGQTRIATAISELVRNVVLYAGRGEIQLSPVEVDGRKGMEVIISDNGPGIENIELAMQDGFSTSGGLGMGLPGTKRLVDEFEISSSPGQGTTVTIKMWL